MKKARKQRRIGEVLRHKLFTPPDRAFDKYMAVWALRVSKDRTIIFYADGHCRVWLNESWFNESSWVSLDAERRSKKRDPS